MSESGEDPDRPKSDRQILKEQMDDSLHEYDRANSSLFLSSMAAGLEIGFSFFLMAVLYTYFSPLVEDPLLKFLVVLSYPIGFILVIIGRADLFTEHTTLAILPVLDNRQNVLDLLRVWGLIYSGNIIGALMFSCIFVYFVHHTSHINGDIFSYYSDKMFSDKNVGLFVGAIFAGWLMGLLGWMVASASETISRIVVIGLITTVIGLGGLAHCVAGAVAIFCAWLGTDDGVGIAQVVRFLAIATLGNTIGGSVFVGLLKYGYIGSQVRHQS